MPVSRGRFIVLEGIDGSGTTTQAHALVAALQAAGGRALYTCEPSDGPVGAYIRAILRGKLNHEANEYTLAALFAADRLDHWDREIAPALDDGADVICDRYVLSSLAYQGLMTGDETWVRTLNAQAPPADLTILLDLPAEQASERRQARGETEERYEPDDTQLAVAAAYRRLSGDMGALVIQGSRPIPVVTAALLAAIEELP